MSEARRWMALKTIESTSLMIGDDSCCVIESIVSVSSPSSSSPTSCHAEAFGGFVEDALRRLGLLQLVADRGGRGHLDLQRRAEEQLQLVELEDVGRIADHDRDVAVLALLRQELVADHQLERDVAGRARDRPGSARGRRIRSRTARPAAARARLHRWDRRSCRGACVDRWP